MPGPRATVLTGAVAVYRPLKDAQASAHAKGQVVFLAIPAIMGLLAPSSAGPIVASWEEKP